MVNALGAILNRLFLHLRFNIINGVNKVAAIKNRNNVNENGLMTPAKRSAEINDPEINSVARITNRWD